MAWWEPSSSYKLSEERRAGTGLAGYLFERKDFMDQGRSALGQGRTMSLCIGTLSAEILDIIASALDTQSLLALRTTSRELNRKTWSQFIVRGFSTISTDLSMRSLKRLREISLAPLLSQHVHRLTIEVGRCISPRLRRNKGQVGLEWLRDSTGCIKIPSEVEEILCESLSGGLVSCTAFKIYSHDHYIETIGVKEDHLTWTDAVHILLSLICATSHPINSLTVKSEIGKTSDRVRSRILQFPFDQAEFRKGWCHMQRMKFKTSVNSTSHEWCLPIIMASPALEELSINLWDDSSNFVPRLNSLHCMKQLHRLELQSARVAADQLINLYMGSGSLEALTLRGIRLLSGERWTYVLQRLKHCLLPKLKHLEIAWVSEYDTSEKDMSFDLLAHNVKNRKPGLSTPCILQPSGLAVELGGWIYGDRFFYRNAKYSGLDMDVFLAVLIQSIGRAGYCH